MEKGLVVNWCMSAALRGSVAAAAAAGLAIRKRLCRCKDDMSAPYLSRPPLTPLETPSLEPPWRPELRTSCWYPDFML